MGDLKNVLQKLILWYKYLFGDEAKSPTVMYTWWKRFKNSLKIFRWWQTKWKTINGCLRRKCFECTLLPEKPYLTLGVNANKFNIGKNAVRAILTEKINRQKICFRFVPHFLTDELKQTGLFCSRDFIETVDSYPNCLKTIVTGAENWCFMYDVIMYYILFPKLKMKSHFFENIPAFQRACTEQL